MSSLFHCIPNECARVVWQPYEKTSGIRYRYPEEDWVYVDGDDWSIEEALPQTVGYHRFYCDFTVKIDPEVTYNGVTCGDTGMIRSDWVEGQIIDYYFPLNNSEFGDFRLFITYINTSGNLIENQFVPIRLLRLDGGHILTGTILYHTECTGNRPNIENPRNIRFETYQHGFTNGYEFTVFKEGAIVHQETREEQPEVELTEDSCKLSETHHEIIIEKTPWLSSIDVIDYGRDSDKVSGVPYPVPTVFAIPENCLNIYRFEILDVLPDGDPNDPEPIFNDYITQICSADGCPRPEYTVYCDCDCESCPDGTCAIECGDHICCNDSTTGKNITSIPIDNYCEI